ncbi:MAG: hypothetical protein J6P03_01515, partial [Opitutales bacterium]|nr:hypothetical protein [Opitutales bacterium]
DYSKFESRAQIDVSSADVSDFIGGVPEFSVVSMSDLNFDSKLKNASLKISANAEASELSRISKNLSSVKSARLSAEISASKTGGNFTLANAEVSVSANGESVLRLKNSNSFSFSKSGIANLADGRLVEIETANIPPEIVEAFLGGISLSFQSLPAKFALAKLGEKFELQTEKPLALKNFTLIKDGKTLASGVSPSISLEGATDLKTANASLLLELKRGEPESFKASLSAALNADKSADFKILANGPLESLAQGFSPDARVPKCAVNSEISASLKNNVLAVKSAGLKLLDGGKAIADFYAQKEILLDAKSGKILSYPVRIEMSADDAPFAAFAPFAGGIGADRFSLRLNLDAESGDAASLLGLIKISNGSYAPEGRAMFENLDASANVDFRLNKKNLSAKIAGLKVSQGAGDIFSADAELAAGLNFENPKISKIEKFKLSAGASLPSVLAQPALKKFDNAHFGTAKISAEFGGENEAVADIRIDNLKPRTMRESVDVVLAKIKARFGSGEIGLPQSAELSFESESPRGKTSALASAREKGGEVFINIAADAVCADDILILKTAFENKIASQYPAANYSASGAKIRIARPKEALAASAAKSTEPPPESAKSATPPAKAPWDFGKTANMNAAVKSAVYEGREYLKNLSAEAKIEPKKIELKKCSAEMFERPASAEFSLSFSGADGYLLESSSLKISDFQIENLLSPNGAGEYFLEGDYTLSASAKGAGRGAEELLKNADANFELSSKNGKLRLIDKSTNVGRISSVGSALLKISAAFLNEKVNELGAVAQLADMLQTLQISDLKISAAKKGDSIEFADARIFAPPILLKMGGKIEGFDPMRASEARIYAPVEMYAQNGEIGNLLKKIGFGQAAGGQYVAGPKFEIYGSLLEPKNNLLEVLSDSFKNFSIKLRRE